MKEALKLALEALDMMVVPRGFQAQVRIKEIYDTIEEALAQPEQYTTDAMKVRQAVAQALHDDVYAEELEQPEAKQSGTISITMPAPVAYLCENAVGHKYFRWKKPSSTYKPIPLYTTPPQRTWVGLTYEEIEEVERWVEFKEEGSGRIPMGKLVTYISEKLRSKNA